MSFSNVVVLLLCLEPSTAVLRGHQSHKVLAQMRPEVVSQLLSAVERKWTQSRLMALRNVTDESTAFAEMQQSCLKVSGSIVQGSDGEKDRVVEYMQDVCSPANAKENQASCMKFAAGVEEAMVSDSEYNRNSLHLDSFCQKFWEQTVTGDAQFQKQQLEAEEVKRQQQEAEWAAKKQQALADAEAKKQQVEAEEAAAHAKKQRQEADDAQRHAAEVAANSTAAEAAVNSTTVDAAATTTAAANITELKQFATANGTSPVGTKDSVPVLVANVTAHAFVSNATVQTQNVDQNKTAASTALNQTL